MFKAQRAVPGSHAPHVYFMQWGHGSPIKIGWSANIGARLQAIGSAHWVEQTILVVTPGDRSTEALFHHRLSAHRVRRTEWFRPHEDVVRMVDDARHNELPDQLRASIELACGRSIEGIYAHTKGMQCPTCHRPTYPHERSGPPIAIGDRVEIAEHAGMG